jgi:hypothetical protein
MIHQHRLRHAVASEDALQTFPHRLRARGAGLLERHQITAVIVQHRQRTDGRIATLLALEVHLPEFVGMLALEPARRLPPPLTV